MLLSHNCSEYASHELDQFLKKCCKIKLCCYLNIMLHLKVNAAELIVAQAICVV